MRIVVAAVVLGALTAPALGQATIADFDRAMQWRTFENREDRSDFLPIQRRAVPPSGRVIEQVGRTLHEACDRFLQRATADADALAFAHITCASLSDDAGARIRHYETALALSEAATAKAHLALAAAVKDSGRIRGHLDAAIAHNPEDPYPYLVRARMHRSSNDLGAALRDVGRAIALNPSDPSAYLVRAGMYWGAKDLDAALRDADRAIAVARDRPAVHVFRAGLRRELGRFDEATADLANAMKWAGPPLAQDLQLFLKFAGVDTGTTEGALQEAIATCIRATPCGADLLRWASSAPRPTCAAPSLC